MWLMLRGKSKDKTKREFVRVFPIWARSGEEKWLADKARRGLLLEKVVSGGLYRFAAAQPAELDFAVEYCGKEPDVPTKIARICNAGWEYVGRYGDCRYYHKPADSEAAHPSKGNYLELDRIKSAQNNLTTVLLLNIPCTVFCLAYVALFIADGFFFSDFSAYNLGYPFFLAWGVFSAVLLSRWLAKLSKRAKLLAPEE